MGKKRPCKRSWGPRGELFFVMGTEMRSYSPMGTSKLLSLISCIHKAISENCDASDFDCLPPTSTSSRRPVQLRGGLHRSCRRGPHRQLGALLLIVEPGEAHLAQAPFVHSGVLYCLEVTKNYNDETAKLVSYCSVTDSLSPMLKA
jgi:hypothetical protein